MERIALMREYNNYNDVDVPLSIYLQIHFFADLAVNNIISPDSLLSVLQSFSAVLDEPGVSYGRAIKAGLCVGEGLIRVNLPFF